MKFHASIKKNWANFCCFFISTLSCASWHIRQIAFTAAARVGKAPAEQPNREPFSSQAFRRAPFLTSYGGASPYVMGSCREARQPMFGFYSHSLDGRSTRSSGCPSSSSSGHGRPRGLLHQSPQAGLQNNPIHFGE